MPKCHVVALTVAALLIPCFSEAQGFRVDGTLFLVHPEPDQRSAEVFAAVGNFRTGLGTDLEIGYDARQYGVTLSGGFAGIDVGEPFSRNGIGMGRQQGMYRSAAFSAHWNLPYAVKGWRPRASLGYVRSGLDNVLLPGDSLPEFARSLGGTPPDTVRRLVGVNGDGVRLGIAFGREISARDFSGRMAVNIAATLDAVTLGRMSYDGNRMPVPLAGTSLIPRLNVTLWWSPWTAPPPATGDSGRALRAARFNRPDAGTFGAARSHAPDSRRCRSGRNTARAAQCRPGELPGT